MRAIIEILILATLSVLIFVKCTCYSCVAKGDSFDMPYTGIINVSFVNDSLKVKNYLIQRESYLPPDEYCGNLGSESHNKCSGQSSLTFINNEDTMTSIKIYYWTDGFWDGVELPVAKSIIINNRTIYINPHSLGVREISSLSINNKIYNNLREFSEDHNATGINKCGYILYSLTDGILKYSIKKANYIENWTIKNN